MSIDRGKDRIWFFVRVVLISAALIVPCVWQQRIQAGDLSSHLYNAWLALLISEGGAPGLTIEPQNTNVLFDLALVGVWRVVGERAAERIVVAGTVLIFFWGAFVFVGTLSRRRPWFLMPCLAMLAYGYVFRMGFFNFYLSVGICLWAIAAVWEWSASRALTASVLLGVAYFAHALPVAWAVGCLGYVYAARRVAPAKRPILLCAGLLGVAAIAFTIARLFPVRWFLVQTLYSTGTDQVYLFGPKYLLPQAMLLIAWAVLLWREAQTKGVWTMMGDLRVQLSLLGAAIVILVPNGILFPEYHHMLYYVAPRMSLSVALTVCAVLGGVFPRRFDRIAFAAAAAVFFTFAYLDERTTNRIEESIDTALAQLPPRQRVLSGIAGANTIGVDLLAHVVDRACIGRCFSYGNYEPSTAQFRVRSTSGTPVVLDSYADVTALEAGEFVVRPQDTPVYGLFPHDDGKTGFTVRLLRLGERVEITRIPFTHRFFE